MHLLESQLPPGWWKGRHDALKRHWASARAGSNPAPGTAIRWFEVGGTTSRGGGTAGSPARRHRAAYSGIDDSDYLIAATALDLDADLLTANVRHFPMLASVRSAY